MHYPSPSLSLSPVAGGDMPNMRSHASPTRSSLAEFVGLGKLLKVWAGLQFSWLFSRPVPHCPMSTCRMDHALCNGAYTRRRPQATSSSSPNSLEEKCSTPKTALSPWSHVALRDPGQPPSPIRLTKYTRELYIAPHGLFRTLPNHLHHYQVSMEAILSNTNGIPMSYIDMRRYTVLDSSSIEV